MARSALRNPTAAVPFLAPGFYAAGLIHVILFLFLRSACPFLSGALKPCVQTNCSMELNASKAFEHKAAGAAAVLKRVKAAASILERIGQSAPIKSFKMDIHFFVHEITDMIEEAESNQFVKSPAIRNIEREEGSFAKFEGRSDDGGFEMMNSFSEVLYYAELFINRSGIQTGKAIFYASGYLACNVSNFFASATISSWDFCSGVSLSVWHHMIGSNQYWQNISSYLTMISTTRSMTATAFNKVLVVWEDTRFFLIDSPFSLAVNHKLRLLSESAAAAHTAMRSSKDIDLMMYSCFALFVIFLLRHEVAQVWTTYYAQFWAPAPQRHQADGP